MTSDTPLSGERILLIIIIVSAITVAIRFLPFIVFSVKETPKSITYLGKVLPCAIMGMLVVYCLKDISFTSAKNFLPEMIASSVVTISYILRKNTLISIIFGTVTYMLLVQFVLI